MRALSVKSLATRVSRGPVAVMALAGVLTYGLTACGQGPGGPAAAPPTAEASSKSLAAYPWPNPNLTITTIPHGTASPISEWDREVSANIAENTDQDYDRLLEMSRYQEDVSAFFEQVQTRYPQQYSGAAGASYDGEPAWVALTGQIPPDLVPLAEALPIAVELRGGAAMSDIEREQVQNAGLDAFTADVQPAGGWGGGLDAPSAKFSIGYVPDGAAKRADEATAAAIATAARAALGRDAAFITEFFPDDRDPSSTEPAVWFLPANEALEPTATTVQVLVDQRACVNEEDPLSGLAPAVVEVTEAEVRIAVSAYIRKGPQGCGQPPLTPLTVDLGQPLGDRVLVDVNGAVDDGNAAPNDIYGADIVVPQAGPAAARSGTGAGSGTLIRARSWQDRTSRRRGVVPDNLSTVDTPFVLLMTLLAH